MSVSHTLHAASVHKALGNVVIFSFSYLTSAIPTFSVPWRQPAHSNAAFVRHVEGTPSAALQMSHRRHLRPLGCLQQAPQGRQHHTIVCRAGADRSPLERRVDAAKGSKGSPSSFEPSTFDSRSCAGESGMALLRPRPERCSRTAPVCLWMRWITSSVFSMPNRPGRLDGTCQKVG